MIIFGSIPKLATVFTLNLAGPYGLSALLFKETDPLRWLSVEYIVFTGFLSAALLATVVFSGRGPEIGPAT